MFEHLVGLVSVNCSSQRLPESSQLFIFPLKTRESACLKMEGVAVDTVVWDRVRLTN